MAKRRFPRSSHEVTKLTSSSHCSSRQYALRGSRLRYLGNSARSFVTAQFDIGEQKWPSSQDKKSNPSVSCLWFAIYHSTIPHTFIPSTYIRPYDFSMFYIMDPPPRTQVPNLSYSSVVKIGMGCFGVFMCFSLFVVAVFQRQAIARVWTRFWARWCWCWFSCVRRKPPSQRSDRFPVGAPPAYPLSTLSRSSTAYARAPNAGEVNGYNVHWEADLHTNQVPVEPDQVHLPRSMV
jgi:hypothetical protein